MFGDLRLWITEIARYNPRLDLIGDPPERWPRRHIVDCLSLLPVLDALGSKRLLDIGSGAGLPGLILAMARPDLQITLCEPSGRRAAVLQTVSLLLEPRGPAVDQRQLSELPAGTWDTCTARAVFPPGSPLLAEALRCCSPGGRLLLQRRGRAAAAAEGKAARESGLCAAWELCGSVTEAATAPAVGAGAATATANPDAGGGEPCILMLRVP